jgi:hypothetical protein
MRKLTLDLDAIQVESFATSSPAPTRGTVDARQGRETFGCTAAGQPTCDFTCDDNTCGCPAPSNYVTCISCAATCAGTTCNGAATCATCMATCNYATGPERCCAY